MWTNVFVKWDTKTQIGGGVWACSVARKIYWTKYTLCIGEPMGFNPYFGQCPKANILLQGKFPNMVSPWNSWVTTETSMPKANVIAPPALPVALSAPARPTFWSALLLSFSSYCQTYSIDSIDRPRQRRYEGSPQQCIKKGPLLCMEGSLITN